MKVSLETERVLWERVFDLANSGNTATCLVVSHRRAALRRADHIIAVSEQSKRDVTAAYGVSPDKITVIYEAAEPRFCPQPAETVADVRARYGIGPQSLLVVSICQLIPEKGIGYLIEAAAKVQGGSPDQYVLLKIAADIAATAGDAPTALQAVEKMAERFDVPGPKLTAETLLAAAGNVTMTSQHKAVAETARALGLDLEWVIRFWKSFPRPTARVPASSPRTTARPAPSTCSAPSTAFPRRRAGI